MLAIQFVHRDWMSNVAVWLAVKCWSEWVMYACHNTITRSPPLTMRRAFDVAVELLQNIDGLGLVMLVGFFENCTVQSCIECAKSLQSSAVENDIGLPVNRLCL